MKIHLQRLTVGLAILAVIAILLLSLAEVMYAVITHPLWGVLTCAVVLLVGWAYCIGEDVLR